MERRQHPYAGFGLTFSMPFECPELRPASVPLTPDVTVELLESVAFHDSQPRFDVSPRRFVLRVRNVGTFCVQDGTRITVTPCLDAHIDHVRAYLLGAALGGLLMQRGVLALHACAIEVYGRAVLFVGQSGAGKSTFGAALANRGHALLADDIVAVTWGPGDAAIANPGIALFCLSGESLRLLDMEPRRAWTKRWWDTKLLVPPSHQAVDPVPVSRAYYLRRPNAGAGRIDVMRGYRRVQTLLQNTYWGRLARGLGRDVEHFQQCVRFASAVDSGSHVPPGMDADPIRVAAWIERELEVSARASEPGQR